MVIMDSGQHITVGNRPNGFHSFPANWQLCSLGEITTSSQYGISSSSGGKYSVPILKMNNLQDGQIDLRDLDYIHLSKAELESLRLNKGDLLINRTNSIDLVGKAAVYDLAGEHVFASYLVRFRLSPSVLPMFVNYFLNSEPGQRKLKLLATKAVSQANINPTILKRRLFIPIPPILEQHRIVEILSALDHSINLTTQLIAKKRDIKQALMQQLLTGKMRLPGFSGKWEVKKLGEIGKIITGSTPPTGVKEYWNGYIPWATPTDINSQKNIYTTEREITSAGLNVIRELPPNSVLVTCIASIGKNAILKKMGSCNQQINAIIPNIDNDANFIYYLMEKSESYLLSNAGITATNIISKKVFGGLVFSFPSKAEQEAIANILSDMDAEIAALEQRRDKTRALKQGMMQELLTGKTRLV